MKLVNGEYIKVLKDKAAELKTQLAASKKREETLIKLLENIFTRWDDLGEYKDDDFGEVNEVIEQAREALALGAKIAKGEE